jgi:hypothetical protein
MYLPIPFVVSPSSPPPTTTTTVKTTCCKPSTNNPSCLVREHSMKMMTKTVRFQKDVNVIMDFKNMTYYTNNDNDSISSLPSISVVSYSSDSESSLSDVDESSLSSDSEDRRSSWYSKSQMDSFRNEVSMSKQIVRNYCKNNLATSVGDIDDDGCTDDNTSSSSSSKKRKVKYQPTLAMNDMTRGLEQYCCTERYRRKVIGIKFIVQISKKLYPLSNINNAVKLANVAQKCNTWATSLALEEGSRDYIRAYNSTTNVDFTTTTSVSQQDANLQTVADDVASTSIDDNEEEQQLSRHKRCRLCLR